MLSGRLQRLHWMVVMVLALAMCLGVGIVGHGQTATTTSVVVKTGSNNPSTYGEEVTLTITINESGSPIQTPSGTVSLFDNNNFVDSKDLLPLPDTSAAVDFDICFLSVGEHEIRAEYSGATGEGYDYAPSSGSLTQTVNKISPSSFAIDYVKDYEGNSATSVFVGEPYTVTGLIAPSSVLTDCGGTVRPTGTVTVSDGEGKTCAANLEISDGSWECTMSSNSQNVIQLTATYEGDEIFAFITGTYNLSVGPRETDVLITGPVSACVGQEVELVAHVSDTSGVPGSPPFVGDVTWDDGAAHGSFSSTTCTVDASGTCNVIYTPHADDEGTSVTISATYEVGDTTDPNYTTSPDATHPLTVMPRSVLIDIACQPATVYINQQANITVTVMDVGCGASVTPTGTLLLSLVPQGGQAGTFVQPTGSSTSTGTIEFTGGKYTPTRNDNADDESHLIRAMFTGTGDFEGITSTGTFPLDVNKREVNVQVIASVSAAFIGEVVTVHVTVQDDTPGTSPCCLVFSGFPVDIPLDDLGSAGGFDESLTGSFSEGSYGYTYAGPDGWPESGSITPGNLAFDLYYKAAAGGAGTTTLQATYPGNDLYKSASGSTTLTVETRPTTTAVTCAPAAVVVDERCQVIIAVADVGPAGAGMPPSGVLYLSTSGDGNFYDSLGSATAITSYTFTGGSALVYYEAETAAAAIDTHILKADYVGTGLSADATTQIHEDSSGTAALTVNLRKTTTTIEVNPETLPYRSDPTVMSSTVTITMLDVSSGDKSSPGGELMLEAPGDGGTFSGVSSNPAYDGIAGNGTNLLTLTWNDFNSANSGITVTTTYTLVEKTVPVHPIVAVLVPDDGKHLASADGTQVNVEVDEESYADTTPGTAPSASEGVISCGLIGGTAAAEIFNFTNGLQAYLDILWAADLGATILQLIPDVLVDVTDPAWSIIHAIFQGGTVDLDGDGIPGLFELGYVWAGLYDFNPDEDGDGMWTKTEIALAGGHFYPTILDTSYSWSRPNPTHPDSDRDGISDGDEYYTFLTNCCDPDTDDDGLSDGIEVGSWATFTVPTYDGAPDAPTPSTDIRMHTDPWVQDTDGDGIRDDVEYYMSGSCPYPNDPDSDNDGLLDGYEDKNQDGCWGGHTGDTLPWTCNCDTSCDITVGTSTTQASKGTFDYWETDLCNSDTDGDGLLDGEEEGLFGAGPVTPTWVSSSVGTEGADYWGTVPALDSDMDNDGLTDYDEVNTYQTDPMDADTDDDTISDGDEVATWDYPDARDHANPLMADTDGDGLTDNLEVFDIPGAILPEPDFVITSGCPYVNDDDSDDDGLQDGYEDGSKDGWYGYPEIGSPVWGSRIVIGRSHMQTVIYGPLTRWETDLCDADSDDDGLLDGEEEGLFGQGEVTAVTPTGTVTTVSALDDDCDNDGLSDYEEVNVTGTDPLDADTDDDGLLDSWELIVTGGTFPYRSFYQESDPLDPDTDDDGIQDDVEYNDGAGSGVGRDSTSGTPDTTCPYVNDDDSDDDGLQDGTEGWSGDATITTGTIGNSTTQADTSPTTGETDFCDPDTDNDGLTDGEEVALLGGLPVDSTTGFTSVIAQGVSTVFGQDGAALTATVPALDDDSDNDGLSDYEEVNITGTDPLDADTDNDTLSDANELIATGGTWPNRTFIQESDPLDPDTDDDDLPDYIEYSGSGLGTSRGTGGTPDNVCPYVNDDDSDDDGLQDGVEDANHDGTWGVAGAGITVGSFGTQAASAVTYWETDLCNPDTDGDGLPDGEEVALIGGGPILGRPRPVPGFNTVTPEGVSTVLPMGTGPAGSPPGTGNSQLGPYVFIPVSGAPIAVTIPALDVDSDNDGLSDYEEVNITGTDPLDQDSDNDTLMDSDELIAIGGAVDIPGNPGTGPRRTFDQESNPFDINTDDDHLFDPQEYAGSGLSLLAGGLGGARDIACPFVNDDDSDDDSIQDGAVITVAPAGVITSLGVQFAVIHYEDFVDIVAADVAHPGVMRIVPTHGDGEQQDDVFWNVCDPDSDGDGLNDGEEIAIGTDPGDWDTDDDGRNDWHEMTGGGPIPTDPFDPDTDDDGLLDSAEVFGTNNTDPTNADTDGDGLCDGGTGTPWMMSGDARVMINPICKSCTNPITDIGLDPCGISIRAGSVDGIGDHPNPHGYGEDKNGNGTWEPGANDYWGDVYSGDETDPNQYDTDGDADGDGIEVLGFSTSRQGWIPTTDLFGRTINVTYPACGCMNPLDPDSDDDGLSDGYEDNNHDGNFDFLPSDFDFEQNPLPGPPQPNPNETNPCDADTDDDDLTDYEERYQSQVFVRYPDLTRSFNPTNPLDHDTDNDWLLDGFEVKYVCTELECSQLDNDTDAAINEDPVDGIDNDGDGLIDEDPVDFTIRFVPMLDPTNRDSDSDGFIDGLDDDPCNSECIPAVLRPEISPADTDGDGFSDEDEIFAGTHPNDPDDHPAAFGMMNLDLDDCFDDRMWLEPAFCCGIANSVVIDIDSNVLIDFRLQIVQPRDVRVGDFDGDGYEDDARYVVEYAFAMYRVVQRRIVATIDDFDMDLVIDWISIEQK